MPGHQTLRHFSEVEHTGDNEPSATTKPPPYTVVTSRPTGHRATAVMEPCRGPQRAGNPSDSRETGEDDCREQPCRDLEDSAAHSDRVTSHRTSVVD